MLKKAARQELRRRLNALQPEAVQKLSLAVCDLLFQQREYREANTLMIFLSTPHEVDTAPIARHAWSNYKTVVAPRVSWEQRRMLPIEIKSLTSDVQTGVLGIREPADGMPIPVGEIDLVIVPGLGFDTAGNRLGRGRGFYDRFLSHRDCAAVTCGVAFELQVLPEVPVEDNDICMNMLVTDRSVRRFR